MATTKFDEMGFAATWCALTNPQFFTSDEFAPAVVIHDRADECPGCGTYTGGSGDCGRHDEETS